MDAILKKLNYKDQETVFVINSPLSFEKNLQSIADNCEIRNQLSKDDKVEFAISFVIAQKEINDTVSSLAPKLQGDAIFWICYPKGTSRKYKCDFNRDQGWTILGDYGFEGVRQVAIDEDWSALRFRKVEYIRTLSRKPKMLLSKEGRARLNKVSDK
jgi:hypothetical protein